MKNDKKKNEENYGCDDDVYNSGDGYLWSSALELCCPFWLRFREDLVDQQGGVISGIGSDSKEEIKKEERRKKKTSICRGNQERMKGKMGR